MAETGPGEDVSIVVSYPGLDDVLVTVTVDYQDQPYRGHGTSIDIVEAGSRAYLEVINRILRRRERGLGDEPIDSDINRASI